MSTVDFHEYKFLNSLRKTFIGLSQYEKQLKNMLDFLKLQYNFQELNRLPHLWQGL